MTDPVLTDDEKNALLDGVASGAVEVHSGDGPKYADVKPFEFAARARIRKNSYPRLHVLNQQLAIRVTKYCSAVLNCEASISADPVSNRTYGDQCNRLAELSAVTSFSAPPLDGYGLIAIESAAISQLVDAFFGGAGNDVVKNASGTFSPGELAVCRHFSDAVLAMLQEVWEPIIEIAAERNSIEVGTDLFEGIGDSDPVIGCRFGMRFGDEEAAFTLLLPIAMIGHLVPIFDGQKRDRDAAEDRRWEQAIRERLPDVTVQLDAAVGQSQLPLGAIAVLQPGEIIGIPNPRELILHAGGVPLLQGRFGVHMGRNTVETTDWIET